MQDAEDEIARLKAKLSEFERVPLFYDLDENDVATQDYSDHLWPLYRRVPQ